MRQLADRVAAARGRAGEFLRVDANGAPARDLHRWGGMSGLDPTQEPNRNPIVVVCGRGMLVHSVCALLTEHGVGCAIGVRDTMGEDDASINGWTRGRGFVRPGVPKARSPWRINVSVDRARRGRSILIWPDEADVLAAAVLELHDGQTERGLADVVAEHRVRLLLADASAPLGGVSARVETGVVFLGGRVPWDELWDHAHVLAAGVPGVTAVVVGRAAVVGSAPPERGSLFRWFRR